MIITKTKLAAALASGTILFNSLATSALAATSLEVSGNGSQSESHVNVNKSSNTTVVQNNDAKVNNTVKSSASTGGNQANDNTGGDVTVATGNAKSKVDLSTHVNLNKAHVNECDCEGDVEVKVAGNGFESDNKVNLQSHNDTSLFQNNKADIKNDVDAKSSTGKNDAKRNTGGDVAVITGHAETDVNIQNKANANIASVGSNGNGDHVGTTSAKILGNGANSDNKINLDKHRSVTLVQNNDAYIDNYVYAKALTGKNNANDNTGGSVLVDTGNATTKKNIDNKANFNAASVDCGCVTDLEAKVAGNGFESDNMIWANLDQKLDVYADNRADLYNDLYDKAKTGKNNVNRNTAEAHGDPAVITGHAVSEDSVSNSANVNLFGTDGSHNPDVEFGFDLGSVFGFFHQ